MKYSFLIAKQVVSPAGEDIGYVLRAYLTKNLKKLSALAVVDENEEELYLPARAVLFFGDALIAGGARLERPAGVLPPIGRKVFGEKGEAMGAVSDFEIGDIPTVITSTGETFPFANAVPGDSLVVYSSSKKKPARKSRPQATIKIEPQPLSEPLPEREPQPAADPFDRFNLLGRRVKRSVFDASGRPIILAGEVIVPDTLSRARRQGRLLELTANTLTHI